jgi:hypothetical protein
MTQFPHDQFAKEYLKVLLSPLGQVETGYDVVSERREFDVWFVPTQANPSHLQRLGWLANLVTVPTALEPFRNAIDDSAVCSCIAKLHNTRNRLERQAKRTLSPQELPQLWMLTPTASAALLSEFGFDGVNPSRPGLYQMPRRNRTGMVVIHQLPEVEETLWLRMLGRGRVQEKAIAQLAVLPVNDPLRVNSLELVYSLQAQLQARLQERQEQLDLEDRKLIMTVGTLFREQLAAAKREGLEEGIELGRTEGIEQGIERGIEQGIERGIEQGIEQGIERGRIEGQRSILENFLQVRLGELDSILALFLTPIATLPAVEFSMLLVRLSMLSAGENLTEQARELLAQTLLRIRFEELDEQRQVELISRLLALSVEALGNLLSRWGEVTDEELLGLLEGDVG